MQNHRERGNAQREAIIGVVVVFLVCFGVVFIVCVGSAVRKTSIFLFGGDRGITKEEERRDAASMHCSAQHTRSQDHLRQTMGRVRVRAAQASRAEG